MKTNRSMRLKNTPVRDSGVNFRNFKIEVAVQV